MKKALLLSAAAMFSVAGFAQNAPYSMDAKVKNPLVNSLKVSEGIGMYVNKGKGAKAPARSVTTGTYFNHPTGTFYVGWGLDGYGSILTQLMTPMNTPIVFENKSKKAYFRDFHGNAVSEAGGNYTFSTNMGIPQFAPILINQRDSFCVGTNNIYSMGVADGDSRFDDFLDFGYALNWGYVGPNEKSVLYPIDDHSGEYVNDKLYTNANSLSGITSTNYLFGNGKVIVNNEERGTVSGVSQYFGTTAAPLCINEIVFTGFSKSQPLAKDVKLTAYITDAAYDTWSNGEALVMPGDNILATLTCEAGDTTDFATKQQIGSYFRASDGSIHFTKKVKDGFGNTSSEPVILPAGTEFCIYVTGLEQDGVDFGGFGMTPPAEDLDSRYTGLMLYKKKDNPDEMGMTAYNGNLSTKIGIVGMYDGVDAAYQPGFYGFEDPDLFYNVVRVTGTGANTVTLTDDARGNAFDSAPVEGADGYPCAPFYTVNPFFATDSEGNIDEEAPNYEVETPEWLSWSIGDLYSDAKGDNYAHFYGMSFRAEALPAGVTGRQGEVKIKGKGVETTIYVLQGDATLDVNNAVADKLVKNSGKMFNIAGQEVGKNFKGIVVKDGKKLLNK